MTTFSIDPGPEMSAYVVWDGERILHKGKLLNADMLLEIKLAPAHYMFTIERIASYGMPVGREVFETCFWTGRFIQQVVELHLGENEPALIERGRVKVHLCRSMRAKDSNIR